MKKKLLFPMLAAGILLVSCTGQSSKQKNEEPKSEQATVQTVEMINLKDSLKTEDGLGNIVEQRYEGILPAASGPGIKYDLTLCSQENSKEGVFALKMTYIEAENGNDVTFTTTGKRVTQKGSAMNADDTIYELIPSDNSEPSYFLVQGDSLTLLNSQKEKNESDLNYTIILVK